MELVRNSRDGEAVGVETRSWPPSRPVACITNHGHNVNRPQWTADSALEFRRVETRLRSSAAKPIAIARRQAKGRVNEEQES